jgi:hypothetical protein
VLVAPGYILCPLCPDLTLRSHFQLNISIYSVSDGSSIDGCHAAAKHWMVPCQQSEQVKYSVMVRYGILIEGVDGVMQAGYAWYLQGTFMQPRPSRCSPGVAAQTHTYLEALKYDLQP